MRRVALLLIAMVFVQCHRAAAKRVTPPPPFDANAFIVSTMEIARSDLAIAALPARKGAYAPPPARQLAADVVRDQRTLLAAITAIAQRRGIASPAGVPDAQAALQENLAAVDDQFAQAFTLAMMQNLDALDASMSRAAQSSDAELRHFAATFTPLVRAGRAEAGAVLREVGGSPFRVAR
jgi:hypothetical protein